ncbi:uncharacterized protein LOC135127933 isoform X2 [Zophobas morio]|uniref:uncharacterized protein LOC135127933 isoform X2 n=1 Tax=Zophobas morio TaxID=2755281 RepID=UPI003082F05B
MSKYFVVLIFQLYLTQQAFCLECYTTDPSILVQGTNVTDNIHALKDCNDYFRDMAKKSGRTTIPIKIVPPGLALTCFTLVTNTRENVIVKGCSPTTVPTCNHVETTVKDKMSDRNSRTFKCSICNTNGCNKENTVTE